MAPQPTCDFLYLLAEDAQVYRFEQDEEPQNGVKRPEHGAREHEQRDGSTPSELATSTALAGARMLVQPAVPAAGEHVQVIVVCAAASVRAPISAG